MPDCALRARVFVPRASVFMLRTRVLALRARVRGPLARGMRTGGGTGMGSGARNNAKRRGLPCGNLSAEPTRT